uniref:Putative hexamerin 2 beta n=1 Tax=Corethrella appendiculata TaxID=1370023 RepID=U5EWU6_9DIPT
MKLLLVISVIVTLTSGYYITPGQKVKHADKEFLELQIAVLDVFQHVRHESLQYQSIKDYKFEENYDKYTNVEAVKKFVRLYKEGFPNMDDLFTIFDEEKKDLVKVVFDVLYYAKDWETFINAMRWTRFNVNEGIFLYALQAAILHRPDMHGVVLPAPYELEPHYFYDSECMLRAAQYQMSRWVPDKLIDGVRIAFIPCNYTSSFVYANSERKLYYFTEDVGVNSYYHYFHLDYPYWLGGKEYGLHNDRRGELWLYKHQQILARYYLERLSNDLGEIPEISWYEPIATGYYPNLHYYLGDVFPSRNNYFNLYSPDTYSDIELIDDYERRIKDAIDYGFVTLPDGSHVDLTKPESIEVLGNLIQGNPDSVNTRFYKYIGLIARPLLSGSALHLELGKVLPGALEHYESSLRDPVFYQLYKRIIKWYWTFKDHLPHYTNDELDFAGVKIENVRIDKLVTYFDNFEADLTQAVDVDIWVDKPLAERDYGKVSFHNGEPFLIKSQQPRLNHMPFSYQLDVASDTATNGTVRVYLGPKFDSDGDVVDINENRENFVLLDIFGHDFVAGKNTIIRNSSQFPFYVKDRTPFYKLLKDAVLAYHDELKFPLDMSEAHCGFPDRLMLPKGKVGGMQYQFYFIISPYHAPKTPLHEGYDSSINCGVGSGARSYDALALGFPFDREIDESEWFTPNMHYEDVMIYHKKEVDLNATH